MYQSSAEVYVNKQDIGSAITGIDNQALFVDEDRAARDAGEPCVGAGCRAAGPEDRGRHGHDG